MDHRFPYYDDPPAPQEPPQIHTPLSPPRPRLNVPSSSRLTPQNAPTDSLPSRTRTIESTRPTSSPGNTDSKNKSRTRTSSSSHSAMQLLNGAKTHLSPPTTMPYNGRSPLTLTRRGTVSIASVSERRDSADMDSRSMISSLLDAYCRSDDPWDDDASEVYSDETATLDYLASPSSVCTFRSRRGSSSTIVAPELAPKRSKSTTLLIEAPPQWGSLASTTAAPRTAPVTKNMRPLPPLPPSQRSNVRPLPFPPSQPPAYAPVVNDNLASTSDIPPAPSVSSSRNSPAPASSPSSSGSTSFVSISSASKPTASIGLSRSTDKPMVSKHHLLPPLLTIPTSPSSQQLSPLPPDIPIPPSPMTARRHQATKLTKILGEQISPELLGPNGAINRVHRLPNPPPVSTAQTAKQHQTTKVANEFSLPPTRRIPCRAVRPCAIYALDDTSEESDIGYVLKDADSEPVSLFDLTDHEDIIRKCGIKIDLSSVESDDTGSSDVGEVLSPSDSILEDMEDMEEARIGWALQNVITYQKAARVKRTSRMWVLEKNGQRWEEQDHTNVRHALRQL